MNWSTPGLLLLLHLHTPVGDTPGPSSTLVVLRYTPGEAESKQQPSETTTPIDRAENQTDLIDITRTGGRYIPPHRLRAMQQQLTDKSSKEYQRITWEALKKSINGLINKVNTANIKQIIPDLFEENLIRGRDLFCRSIMKAQAAFLSFTPVYAAVVAVVIPSSR
ncbi:Pre-mRNA-splicing factor cwc22 [Bifiguratus adelaidae]|uniref:Pre-mRNA-splicing factor cwc22 n=1 Tax=Bifiguratus adelaidae TaxID=1938954 RepID=A0A261XT24_9FUNG|nr:Pre-mRNA-splicing factor cwc22 [Bifiguratus adelaidae]